MRMAMALWGVLVVGGLAGPASAAPQYAPYDRPVAPLAERTIRCESKDGNTTWCPFPTAVGLRITRQLSGTDCMAGRNWGYDGGRIWVTGGCRAEFAGSGDGLQPGGAYGAPVLRCESIDGRLQHCAADARGGFRLVRQLSGATCVQGRSWGWDAGGIWVDRGCRGEFAGDAMRGAGPAQPAQVVRCESTDGRYQRCANDVRGGVRLVRQLSDSACTEGQSWGVDPAGLWVDNGCRGEFALGERRQADWPWGRQGRYADTPMATGRTVRCESTDGRTQRCPLDAHGARLQRQLSDSVCQQGQTWGWDRGGLWVAAGCRGEFEVW